MIASKEYEKSRILGSLSFFYRRILRKSMVDWIILALCLGFWQKECKQKQIQQGIATPYPRRVLLAYWQCTCACTKNYKHTYIICTSYTVNILCGSTAVGPDTRFSMCTLVLEIRVLSRKVKCRNEYKYLYYFLKKRLYCSKAEDIF